jgi:hypothetical protein
MRCLVVAGPTLALMLGSGVVVAVDAQGPATGAFNPAGELMEPRFEHSATLLPDGRVLVIAGDDGTDPGPPRSAELWDPGTQTFAPAGSVAEERAGHTATLLPDGRVLVIGGTCCKRNAAVTEVWDPSTETFSEAAPLVMGRIQGGHTATLLPDGRVLVIGGFDHQSRRLKLAEIWDPATETFREAGRMAKVRAWHSATLLPDGRVLVIGGSPRNDNRKLATAEVWDPTTEAFSPAGDLATARAFHSATLLPDGRVLVIGGMDGMSRILAQAEVWDPTTGSFDSAGEMAERRMGHTATMLDDGRVLVVGSHPVGIAEAWDPATEAFSTAGSLVQRRGSHTATLLPDGRVLVVGGDRAGGSAVGSAEVWDPTAEPPTPWPSTELRGAQDITAGDGRFVVVGSGGKREPFAKVWTSTDGLEWRRAPSTPDLEGASMYQVIGTDDGFVAMGTDARGRVAAWHSPDGLTWERGSVKRPAKKGLEAGIRSVVDGPGGLLALGVFVGQDYGGHRMWRSTDGRSWVPVRIPDLEFVDVLVAIPGGYWLLGHDDFGSENAFWRSSDGSTWERLEGAPWLRDAAVSDDGTVVGIGIADIWVSDDLEGWEQVWQSPETSFDEGELHWIEWDGARFVTTGNVAYAYLDCLDGVGWCPQEPWLMSEDGRTWVESSGPDGVPGPDRETYLLGSATLGDRTVVLGLRPQGRAAAWLTPSPATSPATEVRETAEQRLFSGINAEFRRTCKPKRTNLPDTALAGINCWPGVGPFRLRYYRFEAQPDLLGAYLATLGDADPPGDEAAPGRCEPGRSTDGPYRDPQPGDGAESPYRGGCFIDRDGYAHYLVTSPPDVLTEFISRRPDDPPSFATAEEWRWATQGAADVGS